MTFGEKLTRLIRERGWTQNHAIALIEQWPKTFSRWVKGEGDPTFRDILKICKVFGCDANWLMNDDQDWEDQPGKTWQTYLYVQVFQVANRLGPEEALRRLNAKPSA